MALRTTISINKTPMQKNTKSKWAGPNDKSLKTEFTNGKTKMGISMLNFSPSEANTTINYSISFISSLPMQEKPNSSMAKEEFSGSPLIKKP